MQRVIISGRSRQGLLTGATSVEHDPVLVEHSPKVVQLAADVDEHLIHEPFVARLWPTPLQRVGEQPAEA